MSEKFTILFDLMKLSDALDNYCDVMRENVNPTNLETESIKSFDAELAKEAKNSSALTPFVHQIGNRNKNVQENLTKHSKEVSDSLTQAKELSDDLSKLQKILAKSNN